MISKLPKWVELSTFILAVVAGITNAVGILGIDHLSLSHLSGTATQLGIGLLNSPLETVFLFLGVLLSFLLGSTIAGFLLHDSTLKLGAHYDIALLIESIFLFTASWLLSKTHFSGHFFAVAACGLQNALATTYSGAVIRTTHVTGIFTDLGIMLGHCLRGEVLDKRKIKLFILIIMGFILGGLIGAILYSHCQSSALIVTACICLILAMTYRIYSKESLKDNI